jgi:hypothetical protein
MTMRHFLFPGIGLIDPKNEAVIRTFDPKFNVRAISRVRCSLENNAGKGVERVGEGGAEAVEA